MPRVIVYEDPGAELGPLTDLRASFEVRTGALTTLERLAVVSGAILKSELSAVWARPEVAALTAERFDLPVNERAVIDRNEDTILLNGRCVLPPDELATLAPNEALVEAASGEVIAARLGAGLRGFVESGTLPAGVKSREALEPCLLHRSWDAVRYRDGALDLDLAILCRAESQDLPQGVIAIGDNPIRISPEATVYPTVVLDAEHGPIVIDDNAVVRPGATVIGPAFIGPGSTVLDKALIKAHCAIGPVCKIAGELGGTITQAFTNKAHDGHIGDSWLGEWVNLGAGTTNSNLLNTYTEVVTTAEPGGVRERTGLQFLGSIIGDHTKTAIMTRLMTGAVIGTGCMIATTKSPPNPLGRFEWVTDERRQPFRFQKFMETARAAMARRKVEPSGAYEARLRALCEKAAARASS